MYLHETPADPLPAWFLPSFQAALPYGTISESLQGHLEVRLVGDAYFLLRTQGSFLCGAQQAYLTPAAEAVCLALTSLANSVWENTKLRKQLKLRAEMN